MTIIIRDRTLSIAAALLGLILLPQVIAIFQFSVNGGLDWPMTWGNETKVWSAVFSIFALAGVALVYRARRKGKAYVAVLLFGSLVACLEVYAVIQGPIGPASKADDGATLASVLG